MAASSLQTNDREAELIQRVFRSEHEAFYELMRPCERAIYFTAMSVLSNPADAEEVAQETVVKAFNALPSFRFEVKFSTWILQIAINESRTRLRKEGRHVYDSIELEREDEERDYRPRDFADWREIPSEELQRKELREALKRAIASLAPKYREVLLLCDVQHISIAETAKILGITESSVKTWLRRARLQMLDAVAPAWTDLGSPDDRSSRK
jgi:RNA polymerase sigma-70 factor (ECF subfamily)